jgi:3-mercaptopyruvate sulfurtransferase SseA
MRKFGFAVVATALLVTGAARAQFKSTPAPAPQTTSAPAVQLTPAPAAPAAAPQPGDTARRIARDEAIKMVKAGKAIYIDVRAKEQYDLGHIKGAVNIPEFELAGKLNTLPKNKFLITYCA